MIAGPTGPRKLARDEHEALRLLASSRDGCTQSLMMAHGFAIGILRDLVRDGLVSEELHSTIAGRRADGGQAGAQSDKGNGPLPPHRVEIGVNCERRIRDYSFISTTKNIGIEEPPCRCRSGKAGASSQVRHTTFR